MYTYACERLRCDMYMYACVHLWCGYGAPLVRLLAATWVANKDLVELELRTHLNLRSREFELELRNYEPLICNPDEPLVRQWTATFVVIHAGLNLQ